MLDYKRDFIQVDDPYKANRLCYKSRMFLDKAALMRIINEPNFLFISNDILYFEDTTSVVDLETKNFGTGGHSYTESYDGL